MAMVSRFLAWWAKQCNENASVSKKVEIYFWHTAHSQVSLKNFRMKLETDLDSLVTTDV